jgi:hypothetical protein
VRPGEQRLRPDFAVVGWRTDGDFWVLASAALEEAELRVETRLQCEDPFAFMRVMHLEVSRATITATTLWTDQTGGGPLYVMARGDSYAEALHRIFESWDPDAAPGRPEVTAPMRELGR